MKAMSVGMVFALIFTVIVIFFVLLFGSGIINNIFCFGNNAQMKKSLEDIQDIVENRIYPKSQGSSETYKLNVPGDIKFCFINPSNPEDNLAGDWVPERIYQNLIKEHGYNVWIYMCGGQKGYTIKHLFISPDKNFCAKSGDTLYIENQGPHVSIEKMG